MRKKNATNLTSLFLLIFVFGYVISGLALDPDDLKPPPPDNPAWFYQKVMSTLANVNNISFWIRADGLSGYNLIGYKGGIVYPRETAAVVYQDGIVWGGYVNDGISPALRVGGQTYNVGTQAGRIIATGIAQSPNDPEVRIYRIRRDYLTVSDNELRSDAADFFNVSPAEVTQAEIDSIRANYQRDWMEWPAVYGAPFYDQNGNGVYEPQLGEEPGLQEADQVIWFVCNDLDIGRVSSLYGSPSIGLELQVTIWGYNHTDSPLDQGIFRRYRLINKSGVSIDSMFIGIWSDTDLGDPGDDFLGCDTILNLAYSYNGYRHDVEFDPFFIPPPAIGYSLLQGPLVPAPGETGRFNFREVEDMKNLEMTSVWMKSSPSVITDPPLRDYEGTLDMYQILNGYVPWWEHPPIPYLVGAGPHKGEPTKFQLSGDPISNFGDVDGQGDNNIPSSRRLMNNTGPFNMQPGDTQEVVYALVGGIDPTGDNVTAVGVLKQNVEFFRNYYGVGIITPTVLPQLSFPDQFSSRLKVMVQLQDYFDVNECRLNFYPEIGDEESFELSLYDDGTHEDSLAGDGIWGNVVTNQNRKYPYRGDLFLEQGNNSYKIDGILTNLILRPVPEVINLRISWENGKQDGKINFNEKVHLAFDVKNPDGLNSIDKIEFFNLSTDGNWPEFFSTRKILPGSIARSDSFYFEFMAPGSGDLINIRYRFRFDYNSSLSSLSYPLVRWKPGALRGDTLNVEANPGWFYNLIPIVADPNLLTGHLYQVEFYYQHPDTTKLFWMLNDITTGEIKLDDAISGRKISDDLPVIDGIEWNVVQPNPGIAAVIEIAGPSGPFPAEEWDEFGRHFRGKNVWHKLNANTDPTRWYASAGRGKGNIKDLEFYLPFSKRRDYEIRFTQTGGFGLYYFKDCKICTTPFEIWDIGVNTPDNPADDHRMISFIDNKMWETSATWGWATGIDPALGYPMSDLIYFMEPVDTITATGSYDNFAAKCISLGGAGSYYIIPGNPFAYYVDFNYPVSDFVLCDEDSSGSPPESGTVIRIYTKKLNKPGDVLFVQAPTAHQDSLYGIADRFVLEQNYPNPFNAGTTIRYSLAKGEKVRLDIFNALGQKVKTLINGYVPEGEYLIHWDGFNDRGNKLASGIYFYRLQAGSFVKTRKFILLK
jgi:hypothetical protein